MDREAVIVSAVRTPMGNFRGSLRNLPAQALGVIAEKAALLRCNLRAEEIQEIVLGQGLFKEEGAANLARSVGIMAGLPPGIPALTVNRSCASGLEAVNIGAGLIHSGAAEIVLAGGTDSVSNTAVFRGWRQAFLPGYGELADTVEGGMDSGEKVQAFGFLAEAMVNKFGITRESQDQFAVESRIKAVQAANRGRFLAQTAPVETGDAYIEQDEGIGQGITVENLTNLPPSYIRNGTITVRNSARLADGAAVLLLMSLGKAKVLGLKPLARIVAYANTAVGPDKAEYSGVLAVQKVLTVTRLRLQDMDLIESDEPFAGQCLITGRLLKWNWEKVNVNGGTLALGMSVGACGAVSLVNLVHEMESQKAHHGLVCVSAGFQGVATVISRKI